MRTQHPMIRSNAGTTPASLFAPYVLSRYVAILFAPILLLGCDVFGQDRNTMTTTEENKEIVRRVVEEGLNTGDLDAFRDALVADYARHSQATTAMPEIRGREAMLDFVKEHLAAFPDWHERIDLMIAEGDKVAYITTATGTNTGAMAGAPPTGRTVEVVNYIVHRIENEKIAETWVGWDNLVVLMQLGLFPGPTAGSE